MKTETAAAAPGPNPTPLEEHYPEFVDADGRIEACDALILWDEDEAGLSRIVVALHPNRPDALRRIAPVDVWDDFSAWAEGFDYTAGNNQRGWLDDEGVNAWPETIFGELVMRGALRTREQVVLALHQFDRIRGCDWAWKMLHNEAHREAGL